ncbi:Protease precursor [Marinobacterium lacunae]|uniref:Protease n=1 Tax=Marinobacterium lacunae TaxID=1232683 RepID=A0A081FXC0_9GAMM|nr:S8 family serine peptidase [Marinobacterium lacunae]KEA63175.1 Protease precursor [Marinobacterium lacunae]MBR9882662.1 S8 family serine peptidase [Oceanospirillales bacterium]
MSRLQFSALALIFALIAPLHTSLAAPAQPSGLDLPSYAPDRVLVKFKPGAAAQAREIPADAQVIESIPQIGVLVLQVPIGQVGNSLAALRRNPNVLYAEPDYYRVLVVPSEDPGPLPMSDITNLFDDQWYLRNTGQGHIVKTVDLFGNVSLDTQYGTPGADIHWPGADFDWSTIDTNSFDLARIAVLDSGADCAIPDLSGNGVDIPGKCLEKVSLVGSDPGTGWDPCPDSDEACDNLGHGTFTASEAVARVNNQLGLSGVAYRTGAGIFKVCYQELVSDGLFLYLVGLCPVSHSIAAIGQAADSGYHVITMSYGSDWITPTGEIYATDPSNAECDAIEYANSLGVVVVAAAGNNGDTGKVYPAACTDSSGNSSVIAVAASNDEDDRATFSTYSRNRDDWVSMAAPGDGLIGLLPGAACGISSASDSCVDWWSGTSMSAPLVAGAAALVWNDLYTRLADGAPTEPSLCTYAGMPCNQVVRQRLEDNAAQVGANGQNLLSWTAHGRLDLSAALANDVVPSGGGDPGTGVVAAFSYDCIGLICNFTNASQGQGTLGYSWNFGDGVTSSDTSPGHTYGAAGTYEVTLITTDSGGSVPVSASVTLKSGKRSTSGSVSSSGGGSSGGTCTHPKNKC